jgi:hypothetical protein
VSGRFGADKVASAGETGVSVGTTLPQLKDQVPEMKFCGVDGQSVELRVVGYQFPDLAEIEFDSNWLRIEGKVSHPRGQWSFEDPCLLTYEVSRLADWLDALAQGNSISDEIGFVEPNLSFRIVRSATATVLRVYFELEARPGWVATPTAGLEDLRVEFPLQELDLRQAACSLREELANYPQQMRR